MTRDIDILGRAFSGDEAEIIRRIAAIATAEVDDGVRMRLRHAQNRTHPRGGRVSRRTAVHGRIDRP
ncbi:hypothetical protein [Streptomyces sp. NPDC053728]|uniref:hypothetical protein n=1 Tax=Streptomyces sp. NPDC053728 TaxID=3155534 RepID=UPI0034234665